jgi:putative hydrolase of the HAD superfamily
MARKSHVDSPEGEWSAYDEAYVTAVGVAEELVDHAAEVLTHTRTAHLWRWPIPETRRAIAALASAGVPMGVVSNASGQIEQVLRVSGVCQAGPGPHVEMRIVIDSHVVGVAKPDPAIFDHALPHFDGIERSRIAYVGDSVTMDIGGATAAGLLPILLDPYDDHAGADFARIQQVEDLLTHL